MPVVDFIKSKNRVFKHGEVFTNPREVNSMLDLVNTECNKIDSTFLEPACGDGNFLIEIIKRKFILLKKFNKSQYEWELNGIKIINSIYGIELLTDNTIECRKRLLGFFIKKYKSVFNSIDQNVIKSIEYILSKNIVNGNALTYKQVKDNQETEYPIVFSEWTFLQTKCKEKVYEYESILNTTQKAQKINIVQTLFDEIEANDYLKSIKPKLISESPMVYFKNIWGVVHV